MWKLSSRNDHKPGEKNDTTITYLISYSKVNVEVCTQVSETVRMAILHIYTSYLKGKYSSYLSPVAKWQCSHTETYALWLKIRIWLAIH